MTQLNTNNIKAIVRKYILENGSNDDNSLDDSTLLFQENYLDSIGLYSLITFIEKEFNIISKDVDFVEENYESIDAIERYVLTKISVQ